MLSPAQAAAVREQLEQIMRDLIEADRTASAAEGEETVTANVLIGYFTSDVPGD
jgi:hypothetical protein